MRARWGGAALLAGVLLVAGCSTEITGNPDLGVTVVRGGVAVTTVPPATTTTAASSETTTAPSSSAASSSSARAVPIAENGNGYTFVRTRSGRTRCQISRAAVGCELAFAKPRPRTSSGDEANGVNVGSDGQLTYVQGNLGDIHPTPLDYKTYTARGWTIAATTDGTTFTNDATGHGMIVSTEGAQAF